MSAQQGKKPTLPTGVGSREELHRSRESLHHSEKKRKVFKTERLVRGKEKRHESTGQEQRAVVSWGWGYVAGVGQLVPAIYAVLFLCEPELGFHLGSGMVDSA